MKAWSYSSLKQFENCPKQFFHIRVAKDVQDQQGEAARWGELVHKAFEDRARDDTPLPDHLSQHEPMMQKLLALPGRRLIEERMGLTSNFLPCDFFGEDVWYRGVVDFGVVNDKRAVVLDYKTGKKKEDHDQLSLFAGMVLAHYPDVEHVRTMYLWVASGEITHRDYERGDAQIWPQFMPRVRRLELAYEKEEWPVNPTPLCGWCPVSHCRFQRKRRY
jgi:RecB family exonuclease